jgi:hypothetical protein
MLNNVVTVLNLATTPRNSTPGIVFYKRVRPFYLDGRFEDIGDAMVVQRRWAGMNAVQLLSSNKLRLFRLGWAGFQFLVKDGGFLFWDKVCFDRAPAGLFALGASGWLFFSCGSSR